MTRHVWGQTGKVTPFAGGGYRRRYGYWRAWESPQATIERCWRAQMARCRRNGPATVADVKWRCSPASGMHRDMFLRLVDVHGKAYGRRLQMTGKLGISELGYDMPEVQDDTGRRFYLRHDARVRYVERQDEDPHAAACRALKAQWRLTRNDRSE